VLLILFIKFSEANAERGSDEIASIIYHWIKAESIKLPEDDDDWCAFNSVVIFLDNCGGKIIILFIKLLMK
jgi:hypothetical protein